ncbi:MAG: TolC family protein [Spirochaetia bacterium]
MRISAAVSFWCSLIALLLGITLPAMAQSAGVLTIDQAYELTRKSSEAIRARELALQKSRLGVGEAGSSRLPHVDFQTSVSYLVNPPPGYTVTQGQLTRIPILIPSNDTTIGAALHNYFSAAANLTQPIITWGKIRNAIDLASLQVDAAGTDLVAQQRDIDRQVHAAYYSALLARESAKVLARLRDTAGQVVEDRQKSFENGTINRETVMEARANLATIAAKLTEAAQSSATAQESLGVLTGMEPTAIEVAADFPPPPAAPDEEALRAKARSASVTLASARTRIELARKKLAIERGGAILLPDVSLGLSLGVNGQEDIPFSPWNWNNTTWTWDLMISVGLKMSVFDGLSSANRIGQAEKDAEMAGVGISQEEKLLRLSVRRAVDALAKAGADVGDKQARSEYAEEKLKNARSGFDNGAVSREDMRNADILAGSAALDLLLSRYTLEESCADLAQLTGERR